MILDLILFVIGRDRFRSPPPYSPHPLPVNFFYPINLNNPINLIFSDFKFYKFLNILAKFRRSSPCQFGARTFLSKNFSEFFVLWSLIVVLSFNCLYLALYYLKVVCTQFFIPRLIISFKILFVFQQFMVCKIVTFNLQTRYYICQNFDRNF